jgi:chromosomal replication initiator protein
VVPLNDESRRPDTRRSAPALSEDLDTTWHLIRRELRADVSDIAFETWLEPLTLVDRQGPRLVVEAPATVRSWVERRYLGVIAHAARRALEVTVEVAVVGEGEAAAEPARGEREAVAALNPRYTFDGFVISAANRLAHASALAVAEQPAQAYNPLFLHGPPGLGKTHLLHAIGHYIQAYSVDLRVAYTTVEAFTGAFVAATRGGDFDRFRDRFRAIDVLLVDDVQFLARRTGTMEAFFHTFEALHEAGGQIVLTSDRPPGELGGLEDRLLERFKWGLVAAVDRPDLAARTTILRKRVRLDGIEGIDDATLVTVARLAPESVRALEGALIRLVAFASLTGERPTPDLAHKVLGGLAAHARSPLRRPTVEEVKQATAEALDLTPEALDAPGRRPAATFARQVAMYLARELTGRSLPAIGDDFGGRKHATVSHACRKIERDIAERAQARELVDSLKARLGAAS